MQVNENTTLSVIKHPPDQFYRLEVAYFPRKLTAEDACDQSCYRNARQMGMNRPEFSETGFSWRQILLVIFEMHFNFPSFFIAFVNPHGIVEKFIADKHVTNAFPVLQPASANYEDRLAVNVVTRYNSLILMIFFQISPLTQRDLFYDFRRLEMFSLIFELISVISFADCTESGGVSGIHDLLHMIGAVVEQFDLSEIVSLSVACRFQTNYLISCDIVFRSVFGMPRRQPENEGERDSHIAGYRRHEDIIVAHDVANPGVI